jgi:hypothetical protein
MDWIGMNGLDWNGLDWRYKKVGRSIGLEWYGMVWIGMIGLDWIGIQVGQDKHMLFI